MVERKKTGKTEKKALRPSKTKATAQKKRALISSKKREKPVEETKTTVQTIPTKVHRTYLFAVGRRKTAVARVRLYTNGSGKITINGKDIDAYFTIPQWRTIVQQPIQVSGYTTGDFIVKVSGGGVQSQTESVRHGIARVLIKHNPDFRKVLKSQGFLTRDARVKERKKYGLKRARRAPQWQKR